MTTPDNRVELLRAESAYGLVYFDAGSSGAAKTIDPADGNWQKLLLTGNVTLTISTLPEGAGALTLELVQDATGSRTVTWPASVKWPGGVAPFLSPDAAAIDLVQLVTRDTGTTWRGTLVGNGFA